MYILYIIALGKIFFFIINKRWKLENDIPSFVFCHICCSGKTTKLHMDPSPQVLEKVFSIK